VEKKEKERKEKREKREEKRRGRLRGVPFEVKNSIAGDLMVSGVSQGGPSSCRGVGVGGRRVADLENAEHFCAYRLRASNGFITAAGKRREWTVPPLLGGWSRLKIGEEITRSTDMPPPLLLGQPLSVF
jgi:hypothetical protein